VAVLVLALAMGANASIFSAVYGLLIRPLPVEEPDRLVVIHETYLASAEPYVSYPNFMAWRAERDVFEGMTAFTQRSFDLVKEGVAESVVSEIVTSNFFDTLGVQPILGRGFSDQEDGPVCLVSHRLWKRRWNSDAELLGKTLHLGDLYPTIIGVLPEKFERWRGSADIWLGLESAPSLFAVRELSGRGYLLFSVIGRLQTGVTLEAAQASMDRLARRIAGEDPEAENGVRLVPLREHLTDPVARRGVLLLMASVGLVLLIACANVSNLLLSLATVRQRELAIRMALGASRARLFRQCTLEGLVLSLLGGTLGLFIASASTQLLDTARPAALALFAVEVAPWVVAFQFAVAAATGVLMSLGSALHVVQRSQRDLVRSIGGTPFLPVVWQGRPRGEALRSVLVTAQVAIALVLLAGTGLMLETLVQLGRVSMVSQPERLLLVLLSLPKERYPYSDLERQEVHRRELLEEVAALPGVEDVNLATSLPAPYEERRRSVWLDDGRRFLNGDPADRPKTPGKHAVTPGHFRILGVPLERGRDFAGSDASNSPRVAIVNVAMAEALWPGEDPLRKKIRFRSNEPWHEIIGVVGDIPYGSPRNPVKPEAYVSLHQQRRTAFWLMVRSSGNAALLTKPVTARVRQVDSLVPILEEQTMADALAESIAETRYTAWLLTVLGALALTLCAAGVFGVTSYSVARRTFEFGVRRALGARKEDIWALVIRKTVVVTAFGLGLGVAGALALTGFLESFLYEVEPDNLRILLGASAFLLGCTIAAALAPARRATTVDPAVALRYE
jgi:putative ABC transport system permease protein